MTKTQAIKIICQERYSSRVTKTGLKRVRQACAALGLSESETIEIEQYLEFRDRAGELYSSLK